MLLTDASDNGAYDDGEIPGGSYDSLNNSGAIVDYATSNVNDDDGHNISPVLLVGEYAMYGDNGKTPAGVLVYCSAPNNN